MLCRIILIISLIFFSNSCSKKEVDVLNIEKTDPYKLYDEGFEAFEQGDYFYAEKKFSEAELGFKNEGLAAKASIMSSYALYGINFYSEALESLDRFLKKYPADKNIIYAHYLTALIYYEQISDEKKDLNPLLQAERKIRFFIKEYPESDYALDLRFKLDLVRNQLAAKELYVAKYYIKIQKWEPAINRLKIIIEQYQETIFIEEALHRLVEIHYYLGLDSEAKAYAQILGYNYNSSEWFEQSYKVFNKEYKIVEREVDETKKSFFKKILNKIKLN